MIKIIGAILMIAGTATVGMKNVIRLRGRSKALSVVVSALEIMKNEIGDRLTPIPELFELLSREAESPVSLLFENAKNGMQELGSCSFSKIWSDAVQSTPELMLNPNEELLLCELGMSLGKYNVEEQVSAIALTQKRFEAFAQKAEEERARDSKMHAFLGLASGVFAVIILI